MDSMDQLGGFHWLQWVVFKGIREKGGHNFFVIYINIKNQNNSMLCTTLCQSIT